EGSYNPGTSTGLGSQGPTYGKGPPASARSEYAQSQPGMQAKTGSLGEDHSGGRDDLLNRLQALLEFGEAQMDLGLSPHSSFNRAIALAQEYWGTSDVSATYDPILDAEGATTCTLGRCSVQIGAPGLLGGAGWLVSTIGHE